MKKYMCIEIPWGEDGQTPAVEVLVAIGLIAGFVTKALRKAGVDPVKIIWKCEV